MIPTSDIYKSPVDVLHPRINDEIPIDCVVCASPEDGSSDEKEMRSHSFTLGLATYTLEAHTELRLQPMLLLENSYLHSPTRVLPAKRTPSPGTLRDQFMVGMLFLKHFILADIARLLFM